MKVPARFVCVLAVAMTACGSPARQPSTQTSQDVQLPRDFDVIEGRVPRAATLDALLRQHKIEPSLAASVTTAVSGVFNPRHLQADRSFRLTRSLDGLFREFQYQIDANKFLRVVFRDRRETGEPQFDVALVPYARTVTMDAVTADITRENPSLFAAFDAAGESVQLPFDVAEIFSGEIDFNTELQRGDSASVLFERIRRENDTEDYGDVQAAVLNHGGKRFVGIRFNGADGKPAFYDEQGRSLKREFLKSPLPFEPRITSRFSRSRLHPVFGDVRAHLGVDYAAPTGTPVVAVADGAVEFADWSGNSGRLVTLRHSGGLETSYLHLSSFAPGIRPGVRVKQNQLIGRVGMTGAATGPHLDFRVKQNGKHINPVVMRSKMPPGEPIAAEALAAFGDARDKALEALKELTTKDTKGTK
jgi:murein DD-endopeptidase MepM/ murein hydrolase activator NlpD